MTTNTEALAADTLDVWTINYSLHLDPHALHEFWSAGAPPACAMALKAAVAELRRLLAENVAAVSSFLSADEERIRLRAERDALRAALVRLRDCYATSHSPETRQDCWRQANCPQRIGPEEKK